MKRLALHPLFLLPLLALLSLFLIASGYFGWLTQRPVFSRAFLQLGVLGALLALLLLPSVFATDEARRSIRKKLRIAPLLIVNLIIPLLAGELFLRLFYWEGETFGSHWGPLVRRFERDFEFNRFDGPSRGPEVMGPKAEGEIRLLIQGDSITWGQGVREEGALYTSALLEKLRADDQDVAMAVLAQPGREIHGHLEQLQKWGAVIEADAIIYQWFLNDVEIDKSKRPVAAGRFWRYLFFHGPMMRTSYLYFFLDYHINLLLPRDPDAYADYLDAEFAENTPAWNRFVQHFRAWLTEAKSLTPRVLVALYPKMTETGFESEELLRRVEKLCAEEGIASIDLTSRIKVFSDDYTMTFVSAFDAHPDAAVHAIVAEALHDRLRQLWPELFARRTRATIAPDALSSSSYHRRR